jgi:crotonobetainyl-CoA:carnitine CoA-transferase CaiB-like acyl-CoA transferase
LISITAHANPERVGFGDDAAVAGGLASLMEEYWGDPSFAADAIADPLTGLYAALAAWASWSAGQGRLITLSLADTVAHAINVARIAPDELCRWQVMAERDDQALYPLRESRGIARPPGADTTEVLGA